MIKSKHGWQGTHRWGKDNAWSNDAWTFNKVNGILPGVTGHGLSLVATGAFVIFSGPSLAGYAGTEGTSTPWKINIYDKEKDLAYGFVGAVGGGETLGDEELVNIDFEAPVLGAALDDGTIDTFTSWTNSAGGANKVEGTATVHGGSQAVKMNYSSAAASIRQTLASAVAGGELYKFTGFTRGDGTVSGRFTGYNVTNSATIRGFSYTGVTGTTYTSWSGCFTIPATCIAASIYLAAPSSTAGTIYWDDVTVKIMTDCANTGVHIVSAKNGSTHTWTDIAANFNYNATGYRVELRRA